MKTTNKQAIHGHPVPPFPSNPSKKEYRIEEWDEPDLDSNGPFIPQYRVVEVEYDKHDPAARRKRLDKLDGLIGSVAKGGDGVIPIILAPNQGSWSKKTIHVDTSDLIEYPTFSLGILDPKISDFEDEVLTGELIDFLDEDNLSPNAFKTLLKLRPGEQKVFGNIRYRRLRPGEKLKPPRRASNHFRPGDRIEIQGHAHSKFNGRTGLIQKLVPFDKAYVVLDPNQERIFVDVRTLVSLPDFRVEVWEEEGSRPWVGSVGDLLSSNSDLSGKDRHRINRMRPGESMTTDTNFTIRRKASDVPKDVYQRAEKRWVDAIEKGGIDKAIRSTEIRLERIAPGSPKALGVAQFLTDWAKDHPFLLGSKHKSKIKSIIQNAKKHGKNASVAEGEDNSWGLGYFPLPPHLLSLSRFISGFKMSEAEHKVWPKEGVHMLTIRMTPAFSIMGNDLRRLLQLGLVRIQTNSPGRISFYFEGKPLLRDEIL